MFTTKYCADSAEYSDVVDCVAIGTYELIDGVRIGDVSLYSWDEKEVLSMKDHVDCAGVFDMKWDSNNRLLIAHADGTCSIQTICEGAFLGEAQSVTIVEDGYCLSVSWKGNQFATSISNGSIALVDANNIVETIEAHEYPDHSPAEVWITAFSEKDTLLGSGADDGILKLWDLRTRTCVLSNRRTHQAGVCSMEFSPHQEFQFATGSYDSCIRIWDQRNIKQPVKEELDTGGGVWRVRWHPDEQDVLLAACMRSGFQIVSGGEVSFCYNNGFESGLWESLGYGSAWVCRKGTCSIATASFYDKTFRLFCI